MKSLLGWVFIISGFAIFVSLPIFIWTENLFYIKFFFTSLIVCIFTLIVILIMDVKTDKPTAYEVLAEIEKRQREEDEKNGVPKPKSKFQEKLERLAKERGYKLPNN